AFGYTDPSCAARSRRAARRFVLCAKTSRLVRKVRYGLMAKDASPGKAKDEKAPKGDKAAKADEAKAPKAAPPPRPPADPRLKLLKKFHGKFLPRGPLRDRHKALMVRWESGEDHGGVTAEELKSLLDDWRASRARPPRAVQS